jgi:hypothetical protein
MQKMLRIWGLLSLVVAAVCVVLYWSYSGTIRQQQLNDALIAAIEHDDPMRVKSLLAQGADPNTHLHDSQPVTLLQLLQDLMHGRRLSHSTAPSALQVALADGIADMDGGLPPMSFRHHLSIITLLLNRSAAINPRANGNGTIIVAAIFDRADYRANCPSAFIAVETRKGTVTLLDFVASQREVAEFITALAKAQKEERLPYGPFSH